MLPVLVLSACRPADDAPVAGWGLVPAKNVVIVLVDTLRADHLSAYGYDRETLPRTMARDWAVVHGYSSASSWTIPSVASVFTGLEVHHHGVRYVNDDGSLHDPLVAPTLAEAFASAGYRTAAFVGSAPVHNADGFDAGFEQMSYLAQENGTSNLGQLLGPAERWIDEGEAPFFLYLQPVDPHSPYSPEAEDRGTWAGDVPFDEDAGQAEQDAELDTLWAAEGTDRDALAQAVRDVYDEQLLGLDRSLDQLLRALADRGVLDETLVVLSSDHGETIDDAGDGEFGHGNTVRQELVTVPLLFTGAGVAPGDRDCPSEAIDLMPTLLELQGVSTAGAVDGASRLAGCRETTRAGLIGDPVPWLTVASATARVSWRCTDPVEEEAWDLAADPGAVHPVDVADLADGEALREELRSYLDEVTASIDYPPCSPP